MVRHRGLSRDDVFLASYPRSGNTWVKFVLADLVAGRDLGFQETEDLVPTVGEHRRCASYLPGGGRIVKTHEPIRPEYRRSIYLIRDPRDVALSYVRWLSGFGVEYESLDEFLRQFMRGRVGGYGSWLRHAQGWIEAGPKHEVLPLRYEDLKADPIRQLSRAAAFCGLPADMDRIELAAGRNSADRMRQKESLETGYFEEAGWRNNEVSFVGQASSGGWRDQLSKTQLEILAPATYYYLRLSESDRASS